MAHQSPGIFNASNYFGNNGPAQESSYGVISESTPDMDGFFGEESWPEWPEDNLENHKQDLLSGDGDSTSSGSELDTDISHNAQSGGPPTMNWAHEVSLQHQDIAPPGHYNHVVQEQDRPTTPIRNCNDYQDNASVQSNTGTQFAVKGHTEPPQFGTPGSRPPAGALSWQKAPSALGSRQSPYSKQKNYLQGQSGVSQQGPVFPALQGRPSVPPPASGQGAASFFGNVPTSEHQSVAQSHIGTDPATTRSPRPPLFSYGTPNSVPPQRPRYHQQGGMPLPGPQQGPPTPTLTHSSSSVGPAILPTNKTVQQNVASWFDSNNSGSDPFGESVVPPSNEHIPAVLPPYSTDGQNVGSWIGTSSSGSHSSGQNVVPASNERIPAILHSTDGQSANSLFRSDPGLQGGQGGRGPAVLPPTASDGQNGVSWLQNHNSNSHTQDSGHNLFPALNEHNPAGILPPTSTNQQSAALKFQTGDFASSLPQNNTDPTSDQHGLIEHDSSEGHQMSPPFNGHNHAILPPSPTDGQNAVSFFETGNPGSRSQGYLFSGAPDKTTGVRSETDEFPVARMQAHPVQHNPPFVSSTTETQDYDLWLENSKPGPLVQEGPHLVPASVEETVTPVSQTSELETLPMQDTTSSAMSPAQGFQLGSLQPGPPTVDGQNASPWFVPSNPAGLAKGTREPTSLVQGPGPPNRPQLFHTPTESTIPGSGPVIPGMVQTHVEPIFQPSTLNQGGLFEATGPPNVPQLFHMPTESIIPGSGAGNPVMVQTQVEPIYQPSTLNQGGLFKPTGSPNGPQLFLTPTESTIPRSGSGNPGMVQTQTGPNQQPSHLNQGVNFEPTGPPNGTESITPISRAGNPGMVQPQAGPNQQPSHLNQGGLVEPTGPPNRPPLFHTPTESITTSSRAGNPGMVQTQAGTIQQPSNRNQGGLPPLFHTPTEPITPISRAGNPGMVQSQTGPIQQRSHLNQGGLVEPTGPPNRPLLSHTPTESITLKRGPVNPGMVRSQAEPIQQPSNNEGSPFGTRGPPKQPPLFHTPHESFVTPRSEASEPGVMPVHTSHMQQPSHLSQDGPVEPTGPPKGPQLYHTPKESIVASKGGTVTPGVAPRQVPHTQPPSHFTPAGPPEINRQGTTGGPHRVASASNQEVISSRSVNKLPAMPPMMGHETVPTVQAPALYSAKPGPSATVEQHVARLSAVSQPREGPLVAPCVVSTSEAGDVNLRAEESRQPQKDHHGLNPQPGQVGPRDNQASESLHRAGTEPHGMVEHFGRDVDQQRGKVRGSLEDSIDSAADSDIYEGSLQQQQQRQKESVESKAPLSSLWSSGPGLGTPYRLAPVQQPRPDTKDAQKMDNKDPHSNKVKPQQVLQVGVLPPNHAEEQNRPQGLSSVNNVHSPNESDTPADSQATKDFKREKQREKPTDYENEPSRRSDFRELHTKASTPRRGQDDGQAREHNAESHSRHRVQGDVPAPMQGKLLQADEDGEHRTRSHQEGPQSNYQRVNQSKFGKHTNELGEGGTKTAAPYQQHDGPQSTPQRDDRGKYGTQANKVGERSVKTAAPYQEHEDPQSNPQRVNQDKYGTQANQEHEDPHSAYQRDNQGRHGPHADEYREHDARTATPYQEHEDPRSVYQRDNQGRQGQRVDEYREHDTKTATPYKGRQGQDVDEYREHDTKTATPYQEHEDPRSAYQRDNQGRHGPHVDEYREHQEHEDPRSAYQRDNQGRHGPHVDEYREHQEHEDPRSVYQRDNQGRHGPHADEYREHDARTATPYQEHEDPRSAYQRDNQGRHGPHADEYREHDARTATPYQEHEDPRSAYQRDNQGRHGPHADEYREHDARTATPYQEHEDPRSAYQRDNQGRYGSHANEYRDYNERTDMYYQGHEDPRAVYPQHAQSGSSTPGSSSGRNTPNQYYQQQQQQQQQQWPGYYPHDPRYQQYYGGYYPGYDPYQYHQQYAQYYQQYYYPSQYGWGYSPSQSHSSYEGSQVTDSIDGRGSHERLPVGESAVALEDSPESSVHEEEEEEVAGRITPLLYTTPVPSCKFAPNGKLLVVPPNQPLDGQMAAVEIADIQALFSEKEMKLMEEYPGPLSRDTPRGDVMAYIDVMADECQVNQRIGAAAMWKTLGLLCKHSGTFVMSEVASMLSRFWERPSGRAESAPLDEYEEERGEAMPVVTTDETISLTVFREMLVVGSRKEALEYAMQHQMWGHGLLLASRLDPRTYNNVVSRFLTTLSDEDPLRSLYQHLFGKLPAAARTCKGWVAHLATMVANPSSFSESDKANIVTLGDTLNTDKQTSAAHLCYLLAGFNVGRLTDPAAKVILLGHDHRDVKNEKRFSLESFQMTEIFEYAIQLKHQDQIIPSLQMYKYLYCERLMEAGLFSQALHYLETLAMLMIRSPNMFNYQLINRVMELSDHLAPYDTDRNYHVAGEDEGVPEWKEMLGKLIHARENDVPFSDERESDGLGASQAASFFEGYEHRDTDYQPSAPLSNSSQPKADAQTFEPRDDDSVRHHEDVSSKSDSTTSFQPQASWPNSYQTQDSMSTPVSAPSEQYTSQGSYPESYPLEREQNSSEQQQQVQGGSFDFYQPLQQESGEYGQQPQMFQPDQMAVSYQPPVYDPGEMTGQMTWGTQPQDEPPSEEPKKEKDKTRTKAPAPKQGAQKGWFTGISGLLKKVIPGGPNEIKLPDDSNKSIYYDKELKRWVNTDEDEEDKAPPPPPPTDFQLGSPGSTPLRPAAAHSTASQQTPGPSTTVSPMGPRHAGPAQLMTPQHNMSPGIVGSPLGAPKSETPTGTPSKFSRKAHSSGRLGSRAKYVDVFKSGGTSAPIAPPSLFQVLPDDAPIGFFTPPAPDPSTVEGERKIANPSSRPSSRAEEEVEQRRSRSSSQSSISMTSAEVESYMSPNYQEPQQTPMFFDPSQMADYSAPKAARNVRRF